MRRFPSGGRRILFRVRQKIGLLLLLVVAVLSIVRTAVEGETFGLVIWVILLIAMLVIEAPLFFRRP